MASIMNFMAVCGILIVSNGLVMVCFIDDNEEFGQKIYDWANKAGTLLTCVLRECLESSNDLETSMLRVTVRRE